MFFRIVSFLFLLKLVYGNKFYCSHESAIASFKRPTYNFSMEILKRVAHETSNHFVFSPLSTWIQLMSLAEGARGDTKQEIWSAMRYHRMKCFRRKFRQILNLMDEELNAMTKRVNLIAINKLLNVKKSFEAEIKKSNTARILALDFNDPVGVVEKVNKEMHISDVENIFNADDFNLAVLLATDSAYFKSDWQTPFDPVYTSTEPFYLHTNITLGKVRMMSQVGSFNLTEVPFINARVLELPFNSNGRLSMLVFLPNYGTIYDLFYNIKNISLSTIFSLFTIDGMKQVTVRLPRFKIRTEILNIPELINDMGVTKMFYQDLANFKGISDYKMHASLMTQVADIEVTEKGVSASAIAQALRKPEEATDFVANQPFAYLIVDRKTQVILFGGMYRNPSVY